MRIARKKLNPLDPETGTQIEIHDHPERIDLCATASSLAFEGRRGIIVHHKDQTGFYILRQNGRRPQLPTPVEQTQGDIYALVGFLG